MVKLASIRLWLRADEFTGLVIEIRLPHRRLLLSKLGSKAYRNLEVIHTKTAPTPRGPTSKALGFVMPSNPAHAAAGLSCAL